MASDKPTWTPAPTKEILLECDCGCSIVRLEYSEDFGYILTVFSKYRLRRGKIAHELYLSKEQVGKLKAWLEVAENGDNIEALSDEEKARKIVLDKLNNKLKEIEAINSNSRQFFESTKDLKKVIEYLEDLI